MNASRILNRMASMPTNGAGASTGLRVIGAGMGRTGTASLKRALEHLEFGPCHHMEEVIKHPRDVATWEAAARGEKIDWARFFANWGAAVDIPAALYYRELMATFPEAKIILTLRDGDAWYESMRQTIYPVSKRFPNRLVGPYLPFIGAPIRVVRRTQLEHEILDRFADRAHVIEVFHEWNEEVRRAVPAERLLVFEVKEGWAPLCEFLGVPVPDLPFPRVNDSAEFRKRVVAGTIVCWVALLLPVSVVFGLLAWLL